MQKSPEQTTSYTCALCGGEFTKEIPDAVARAEMEEIMAPGYPDEPIDVVCEDCYKQFRRWLDALSPGERAEMERRRARVFDT